ncbi:hypothetical protein OIO90_006274 [Microbotryomycetes sp. JL221]|nr:hypothetical protein OIO90_006274 [Microbotryomycetes sp. JL221]
MNRVQSNSTYRQRNNDNNPTKSSFSSTSRSKASSSSSAASSSSTPSPISSAEQVLLSCLHQISKPYMTRLTFGATMQQLKKHLFDKDYEKAFGTDDLRFAYTTRWVPSRALIYRRIFEENNRVLTKSLGLSFSEPSGVANDNNGENTRPRKRTKVVQIGGGAGSEVVALSSWFAEKLVDEGVTNVDLDITAVDTANWSSVLRAQQQALITTYPQLEQPKPRLSISLSHADVLNTTQTMIDWSRTNLVTILFTISELFLQSRTKTLSMLSTLSNEMTSGSLLLIVESASLSLIPVGTSGRSYPLGLLLDGALTLDKGRHQEERAKWECLTSEDAKWYRMPLGAEESYPGQQLENSRLVLRLYRRL